MENLDPIIIVMIVAGVVGIFALMLMLQLQSARESNHIKKRLDRTRGKKAAVGQGAASLRLTRGDKKYAAFDILASKYMPKPQLLAERLERTGYNVSIGQFAMYGVLAGAVVAILLWLTLSLPPLVLLLIFAGISMLAPHKVVSIMITRRQNKFINEFPEALELIIRGLRSGLPIPESIKNVGEEFAGPVGQEFRGVSDKVKVGQSLEEALWDSARRVDVADFKFFVISLAVQRETGGNLAETLANLVDILRRRRQMKLKIKAMSSEAKASALILGSLPFIMFGILMVINKKYVSILYLDPRGHMLLAAGLGIIGFGAFVMKKMVSFEI